MNFSKRFVFVCAALVFLASTLVVAQERSVVNETFQNNSRYWVTGDIGYAKVVLTKGSYQIERKQESGESFFTIDSYLNPDADFSIESTFQILKANEDAAAGLLWNHADLNYFDSFTITNKGTFNVLLARYGELFDISGSVPHPAITKKVNALKVMRKGNVYEYYINEALVFKSEFAGYSYTAHGFYVTKQCTLKATSFEIKQSQVVNEVKDFSAKKELLGAEINTANDESSPLISPDGTRFFFTRKTIGSHNADVWLSQKTKEGTWAKAENIGYPINNNVHNSVISCSADNRALFLLNTYFGDASYKGCCFSMSTFVPNSWSVPYDVNIENINHYGKWLDASLSVDNRTMLLSALRPGTLGYNDLYVSFKNEKGVWTEPLNLGKTINTPFNEAGPFLASDNKTLYFSSVGYPGYGNQDIFMSRRLDDSWTNWSTPINLGEVVNSEGFDAFFTIASNEEWAYLVSSKASLGGTDIFKIKLPLALRPHKVCMLSGKVLNKNSGTPLHAKLMYQDLNNKNIKGTIFSNEQTGEYQIILPDTGTYYISTEKKNYYAYADSISFVFQAKEVLQKKLTLYLEPLTEGKKFTIRQLYFEQGKANVLPSSISALEQLFILLKENNVSISIEGHTDNVGDVQLNLDLSIDRANAVKTFLISRGIDETRLKVNGYGGTKPIADNAKEETRRLNRRVEFVILGRE